MYIQILAISLTGLILLYNLLFPFNPVAEHAVFGFTFLAVSQGYAVKRIFPVLPYS